jgi:hypothetical protein
MISSRKPRPYLGSSNKEKIMRQLGAITSQLLNLLFDKISSLFKEEGEYRVKEDLSLTLIWHQQDSLGDDIAQGLFQHNYNYFKSLLSALLVYIKELPLKQHAFFALIPKLKGFKTLLSH